MQTPTSPNFSDFSFRFCIDLSTITSSIVLTDTSTFIAAGFQGEIFNIYAPSGLLIHQGDWSSPDITVENDSYTFSPLVFMGGQLMTGTYKVEAYIKDQNGVVYQWSEDGVTFKAIEVCLPNSLPGATGYFGGMALNADADCENYRLCFFDTTPYVYKGVSGTNIATSLKVIYPPDPNTFSQQPAQQYSVIPSCYTITVNGRYQFQAVRIYTYELGNDTCITFRYQFMNENFIVACNANLCAIMCDYERLIQAMNKAQCNGDSDYAELTNKVILITSLMVQFEQFKRCGKDVAGIIDQIIEIGNFDCESCRPTAITPNPIICNNGVFSVITPCGDISAEVTQEGNNVQISLQDITYQFVIDQASQTYLTKVTTVSGCTSQTTFTLNLSSITDKLCQVATDESDNCCDYLEDKLESSDSSISIETVTVDEEGCRKIDLTIPSTDWTSIEFETAMSNTGGANQVGEYRKTGGNMVELRGGITASDFPTSSTVTILPVNFRPPARIEFPVSVNNTGTYYSGVLSIAADGTVVLLANTSGWTGTSGTFHLSVIRFSIA